MDLNLQNLKKVFGHENFKNDIQRKAISHMVNDVPKNLFVCMPTGAGKSLCYQYPILHKSPNSLALVVSPLLALINDQILYLNSCDLRAVSLNSSISKEQRNQIISDLALQINNTTHTNAFEKLMTPKLRYSTLNTNIDKVGTKKSPKSPIKFLYVTPELISKSKWFSKFIQDIIIKNLLAYVVIDEAHCVSQWGHDFRPDYLKIKTIIPLIQSTNNKLFIPIIALTATSPAHILSDILNSLGLQVPNTAILKVSCFRSNLFYEVRYKECMAEEYQNKSKSTTIDPLFLNLLDLIKNVSKTSLNAQTKHDIKQQNISSGLIYCRTREECDIVAIQLNDFGILALAYHAGLKDKERKQIQEAWMSNKVSVVVATISFGMGIDKPDVRFVIHWNMPKTLTHYYQESGRAGRDGKPSFCTLYYSLKDRNTLEFLNRQENNKYKARFKGDTAHTTKEQVDKVITTRKIAFDAMIDYCESMGCRHAKISKFFGDTLDICKTMCDYCMYPDKTLQRFLSFQSYKDGLNQEVGGKIAKKSSIGKDIEIAELYEGGKRGISAENKEYKSQRYADDDDNDSSDVKNENSGLADIVKEEFRKRKSFGSQSPHTYALDDKIRTFYQNKLHKTLEKSLSKVAEKLDPLNVRCGKALHILRQPRASKIMSANIEKEIATVKSNNLYKTKIIKEIKSAENLEKCTVEEILIFIDTYYKSSDNQCNNPNLKFISAKNLLNKC